MPTPQRMEVAEVLLDRAQHLSAEQIMDRLRDAGIAFTQPRPGSDVTKVGFCQFCQ